MNKRILISLSLIAAVAAVVIGGTVAYFSDTETSTGNTFTAGTIDIAIDGENPWEGSFVLEDMKPCEKDYIKFVITNVGTNPVVIWKHLRDVVTDEGVMTEPECVEEGGTWVDYGDHCTGETAQYNLDGWILYDLSVRVPIADNPDDWHQVIYDQDVWFSHIVCEPILLGMLPVGGTMEVTQSYHLDKSVTNWAQGDVMTFTIEIIGEQQKGELVLENKNPADDKWDIIQGDGIQATLTYNTKGPKFDYSLTGKVKLTSTDYDLIYYADPWPGNNPGALIGTAGSGADGSIVMSGSTELNMDLPVWPNDQNHPEGAKIWLVPSSDYPFPDGGWNPANYLFDTALITYDDTDI